MRITYCADYGMLQKRYTIELSIISGKWPNGSKMVRTYGQYLPLFETLYAFQKQ